MNKNLKKILFFILFLMPINVYAECNEFCNDLAPAVKLVKILIEIFKIGIPIGLILMGAIDLVKAVTAGKEEEQKRAVTMLGKRFIYAVAVFLVITIVSFAMNIISEGADIKDADQWWECYSHVDECPGNITASTTSSKKKEGKCYLCGGQAKTYSWSTTEIAGCSNQSKYTDKAICLAQNSDAACYVCKGEYKWGKFGRVSDGGDCIKTAKSKDNCRKTSSGTSTNINSQTNSSNKTKQEKLAMVFPKGVPTTESEVRKYLIDLEVPITRKDGTKETMIVEVHKAIAGDVKAALEAAQKSGFKVYEIDGYRTFGTDTAGKITDLGLNYSQHCYGLAVDINVEENCYKTKNGSCSVGSSYLNGPYAITTDTELYKSFISNGWGWGGNWNNTKDYMHFSYFGT